MRKGRGSPAKELGRGYKLGLLLSDMHHLVMLQINKCFYLF